MPSGIVCHTFGAGFYQQICIIEAVGSGFHTFMDGCFYKFWVVYDDLYYQNV